MALKLFNTLTRTVEEFSPLDPSGRTIGLYCCGPTVHDYAHIGNFRTFIFADITRRWLEFKGYAVRHVMNITDVEDKIIRRVREGKTTLRDYTAKYEKAFFEDLGVLNCLRPHHTPRATEHIADIIALVGRLEKTGIAYRAQDGSVYFSIGKYRASGRKYGQLLNLNFDRMRPGERVSSDEYEKESLADFALWKARVPEDGEVFWPSPWGEGRPGWHIECSAMSMKVLGPSFDLHLGGEDLVFPHHEDEIAQSEGAGVQACGCRFVKHWMHGAHLLVEGKKMSKSLGNFFTLRDLLAKGYSGMEIRCLMTTAHYREKFNFTLDGLQAARTSLGRLGECLDKLREAAGGASAPAAAGLPEKFEAALDDDLNVSNAWAAIFDWVRECNRLLSSGQMTPEQAASQVAAWHKVNAVLGLDVGQKSVVIPGDANAGASTDIPAEILALLEQRQAARKAKEFKRSDELRDELKAAGWVIEDTPKGPRLKRV